MCRHKSCRKYRCLQDGGFCCGFSLPVSVQETASYKCQSADCRDHKDRRRLHTEGQHLEHGILPEQIPGKAAKTEKYSQHSAPEQSRSAVFFTVFLLQRPTEFQPQQEKEESRKCRTDTNGSRSLKPIALIIIGGTSLEKEGKGYVVDSLGVESGYVPYTAYCARGSYLKENEKTIQNFVNALKKGMEYVSSHTPEDIAKTIQPQFKETDLDVITRIVRRYAEQDTWKTDLNFEKESFELLEDILEDSGELSERVSYEDLVTTKYAREAAEK